MSPTCQHCGTPVPPTRTDGFCCSGCRSVHDLLQQQGLAHFYDLKSGLNLPPVPAQAMRQQDYTWLETATRAAEAARPAPDLAAELTVSVQGLSCMACIWLIERVFAKLGGTQIHVDISSGELRMAWQPEKFQPVEFARELQCFGYLLGMQRADGGQGADSSLERRTGVCGAFAMNAMAFSLPAYFGMPADFPFARAFDLVAAASATLALLVGGSYFAQRAWHALRAGVLHIDTPITLGILAAYAGSLIGWLSGEPGLKYFDFVAMFIFLMLGGRLVQQMAVARNRRRLLRDPSIPEPEMLESLQAGTPFSVKPGQAVPVAAKLSDDYASISLEWISGESDTSARSSGQLLPSGALNAGTRTLQAVALEAWQDSTLHKLLEARRSGDHRDLRLEKLLRGYLIVVVIAGIIGGAAWWWHTGEWARALQVMISVFVVSCPCALGVAAPLADDIAAARAADQGIFVRSLFLWKKLTRLQQVVFDKTGTLTLENPQLLNPAALEALDPTARRMLRHLTSGNLHPVSRSLFDALGSENESSSNYHNTASASISTPLPEVQEEHGQGLRCTHASTTWALSRPASAPHLENSTSSADALFTRDGHTLCAFRFRDALRAESLTQIEALQARGLHVSILSGDREAKVAAIATQLHLQPQQWQHSLTPEQKAAWISSHQPQSTLYIGDGANDSLAFDAASCAGSPVTGRSFLEHKADFYFLGHSMRFISPLLDIAATHRRAVHAVFAFSVTYNIITVIIALGGNLSPLLAAILMPLSSLATLSLVALLFRRRSTAESREGEATAPAQAMLPSPALAIIK